MIPVFGRPGERVFEVPDQGGIIERTVPPPIHEPFAVAEDAEIPFQTAGYCRRLYRKRCVVLDLWPLTDVRTMRYVYVSGCDGQCRGQPCLSCENLLPQIVRYLLFGRVH